MACGVDDDEDVIFGLPFSNFWLRLLALRRPEKKIHACSKASWDTFTYDQDLSEAICQDI